MSKSRLQKLLEGVGIGISDVKKEKYVELSAPATSIGETKNIDALWVTQDMWI